MSDRRRLWNLLYLPVVALLAAGVLAMVWLSVRPLALPWLNRWASESDPDVGPPPEAFERFRRQQDEIANGADGLLDALGLGSQLGAQDGGTDGDPAVTSETET